MELFRNFQKKFRRSSRFHMYITFMKSGNNHKNIAREKLFKILKNVKTIVLVSTKSPEFLHSMCTGTIWLE